MPCLAPSPQSLTRTRLFSAFVFTGGMPIRCLIVCFPLFVMGSFALEVPDLRALARQTRPAVYLLVLQDEDGKTVGSGTGFLVSPDGRLVTNHHVSADAKVIIAHAEKGGQQPGAGRPLRPRRLQ